MATSSAGLEQLAADTFAEIKLLVETLWTTLSLAVDPIYVRGREEALKSYYTIIPSLIRDIWKNSVVLFSSEFPGMDQLFYDVYEQILKPLAIDSSTKWHSLIQTLLDSYTADLLRTKGDKPEDADRIIASALDRASTMGLGSYLVTVLTDLMMPKGIHSFNWIGPLLAKFSGYEEIIAKTREPQYQASFGNLAEYNANQNFRTKAPSHMDAVSLYARGIITQDQYQRLISWAGLMQEFDQPMLDGAYRPISAFIAIRLFATGIFTDTDVRDVMQFNGLRPVDLKRMLAATDYLALAPARTAALGQVRTAWERGAITDAEFDDDLHYLEIPLKQRPIIKFSAAITKLIDLDTLYRKSVSEAYLSGQLSDAEYVPHLEAIGINAPDAEAHYAVDSIKLHGKEIAAQKKSDAAAAKHLQSEQVKLALAQYHAGAI